MASNDSGVETGNESNDGPLDVKTDDKIEQISTVAVSTVSNMFPLLSNFSTNSKFSRVENAVRMASFLSGPALPPFQLPSSCLPPGFVRSPPDRRALFRKHVSRKTYLPTKSVFDDDEDKINTCSEGARVIHNDWKNWEWTDGLAERKLRIATSTNNIELVQTYLFSGVNPNCVDSMGRSPLHLASCSGYADIVRLLLENGANPNQCDRLGNTPLHLAACTNNIVVVTLLLKAGTDVCSIDLHGRSPLQLAQSKLKLLQKHISSDSSEQSVKNQSLQVSAPPKEARATVEEMPIYDNAYVSNQALQIVEMMKLFLQKRGQEAEADLLSAFSSRLNLSETKEQVETQVRDLLDSLSGLSLDSISSRSSASATQESAPTSEYGNTCTMSGTNGVPLFPNTSPPSSSRASCSLLPSSTSPGLFDSQAGPVRHKVRRRHRSILDQFR